MGVASLGSDPVHSIDDVRELLCQLFAPLVLGRLGVDLLDFVPNLIQPGKVDLLLDLFMVLEFELDVVQRVVGLEGQLVVLAVEGREVALEEVVSLPQFAALVFPLLSHLNLRLDPVKLSPDFSSDTASFFKVRLHFENLLLQGRVLAGEESQSAVD